MGKEAPVISLAGASSFSPLLALIRFLFYPHFNQHPVPVKQQNSRFLFLRDIPACRPTKHEKAPELPGLFASTKSAAIPGGVCNPVFIEIASLSFRKHLCHNALSSQPSAHFTSES